MSNSRSSSRRLSSIIMHMVYIWCTFALLICSLVPIILFSCHEQWPLVHTSESAESPTKLTVPSGAYSASQQLELVNSLRVQKTLILFFLMSAAGYNSYAPLSLFCFHWPLNYSFATRHIMQLSSLVPISYLLFHLVPLKTPYRASSLSTSST